MDGNKSNSRDLGNGIKPLVILVDGIDCSGKSTLVESLGKKFPGIVIKPNYRPKDKSDKEISKYKRHAYAVMEFINQNRKDLFIILDRFYSSELVYSKVKRKYDAFDDMSYTRIERSLASLPHLYIYCAPSKEVIIERLKTRGDDYINEKDVDKLYQRYEYFYENTKLTKIKIDTSKSIDSLLLEIEEKI